MKKAYYNEIDPYAIQWLKNLISVGHIAPGDVDDRSIEDVTLNDLRGYTQCHFFAGIGIWSYALRRSGWEDDRPVWTGSCPCQPFSAAGKREGFTDERHLWPHWYHLISQCQPDTIFGEQVASKDGLHWFDTVQFDLEGAGYTLGASDLCAAGIGAPHIRQRLWFVAHTDGKGWARRQGMQCKNRISIRPHCLANQKREGPWSDAEWIYCRDGKFRPIKPGTPPLVNGFATRVGRVRAYGNAINAEVAKTFIEAYLDVIPN